MGLVSSPRLPETGSTRDSVLENFWGIERHAYRTISYPYRRRIHFVHARAARENALTLVMTHGWPGSFFEFYKGQPDEGEYIYRE